MTTRLVVCGAAGRMGKTVLQLAAQNPSLAVCGAVETASHPALGRDAGTEAGGSPLNVAITSASCAIAPAARIRCSRSERFMDAPARRRIEQRRERRRLPEPRPILGERRRTRCDFGPRAGEQALPLPQRARRGLAVCRGGLPNRPTNRR